MSKLRETSTDKDLKDLGTDFIDDRKPDWVDHAHLDAPLEESLANRLIYKPALRFHGLTGGLWGAKALSDTPSLPSDRPPSYKMVESMKARSYGSGYSDTDTVYNSGNISAMSPLTLRRRNTVAVVLVAIALLAAAATITGVTLHFLHPKGLLRANVRFTIANRNFTEGMVNSSSMDFHEIEKPLCEAMDEFFLSSELADFYLGCKMVTLRNDVTRVKNGTAVHYNLDFIENSVSNDGDRIKKIIMRRSGRHKTDDTLYLVIRDFLVYLRSLRIDLEVLPLPDDHPGRRRQIKIPWNREIDFIPSKSGVTNNRIINERVLTDTKPQSDNIAAAQTRAFDDIDHANVHRLVLPGSDNHDSIFIEATPLYFDISTPKNVHALHFSKNSYQKSALFGGFNNMFVQRPVNAFNKRMLHVGLGFQLTPSKSSMFSTGLPETGKYSLEHVYPHSDSPVSPITLTRSNKQRNRMALKDAFDRLEFPVNHAQLQTSFDDITTNEANINNIATEELFGKTIELKSRPMRSANSSSSKMTTLTSGMYIIRGSKTNTHGKTVTSNEKLTSNAVDRHAPFNNVPELKEIVENGVVIRRSDARPYHFKSSVITTPIENSILTPPVSDTGPSVYSKSSLEPNSILSIAELMDPADKVVVKADSEIQMNEFVNVLPEREPIHNSGGNPEWINLFNDHQVTDGQSLTEVTHMHRDDENALDLITSVDSNNLPPDTEWINILNQPKIATIQYVGDLGSAMQSDNTKKINLEGFSSIKENRNENDVIVVVRDTKPTFTTFTNTAIPFDNNVNGIAHRFIHGPKQTLSTSQNKHDLHRDEPRHNMEDQKSASNLQKTQYQNKFAPENQVVVQLRDTQINPLIQTRSNAFNSDRPSENGINPVDIPKFKVIRRMIDGRPVLMLREAGPGEEQYFSDHGLSDAADRQTWNFLQKIGMNLTTSDVFMGNGRVTTRDKQTHGNRNFRSGSFMFRKARRTRSDVPNSKTSFMRKSNVISGRQGAIENAVEIGRKGNYPLVQRSSNTGFPESGSFNDIDEMKEILRQLVHGMEDMTGKLDSMQSAIDFINKTFHETHEPLFSLQRVLNNMTVSLDNMNANLQSINQTLKDFKDFLKQFKGTVFNSDDVIRHIDESISNIGKTVVFIESSVMDLNGTATSIAGNIRNINETLTYVSNSVWEVNYTTIYSNETLDSMIETLESLDAAINGLTEKFNVVTDGGDVFAVSLKNINQTVKNTHDKLKTLHGKMFNFNTSLNGVTQQVERLNLTYGRINKTLESLNETYMFTNGTVLEVITKLAGMDVKLKDLNGNVNIINTNITSMNSSLLDSLDSLIDLVQILTEFNLRVEENNNSIVIDLKHKDLLETMRMLLNMNGTLSEIGQNVDVINERIDLVDQRLGELEKRLAELNTTLDTIDVTFKMLNDTLQSMNQTVRETNKSLASMDSTLSSMNSTFDDIGVTFGNINDTLNTVNKTLSKIRDTSVELNETLIDTNQTFLELRDNIKATNKTTNKLNTTISGMYGSVTELNSQIHNANESLRIVRSKADIAHESYRMLNDTIKRIEETFKEISSKLDETNVTMVKTNSSLSYVNNSISSMQNSFRFLSDELKSIQGSLQTLESRIDNFGSAFPHISNVINDTKNALTNSKRNLADMNRKLGANNNTRDEMVSKFATLIRQLSDTTETINNIGDSLNEIKALSSDVHKESETLRNAVSEAELTYSRTENNVNFINKTHETLKDDFQSLQENKTTAKVNLDLVQQELRELEKLLDTQVVTLENNTNIDANIDKFRATLNDQQSKLDEVRKNYNDWSRTFDDLDGILWDDKGFPTSVHLPYETLKNTTKSVNMTLQDYRNNLNYTEENISNILQLGKNMRKRFQEIDSLKNTIDEIEDKEKILSGEIKKSNERLKAFDKNLTSLLNELKDKLDDVKLMESMYGDINGTYNVSMSFDGLEDVLKEGIKNIQNAIQKLGASKSKFGNTTNLYLQTNNTFHDTVFRLNPKSTLILNETLLVMDNTKLDIMSLKGTFDDVLDIIENVKTNLQDASENFMELEDKLNHQKRKNNYVTKYQPIIGNRFKDLFQRHNKTDSEHDNLLKLVEQLNQTIVAIKNQSDKISNVNISLDKEEMQIGIIKSVIINMKNNLKQSKDGLDKAFEKFESFDESNKTFDQVKAEYATYRQSIASFEDAIGNMNTKSIEMRTKINDVSNQLDDIQKVLSQFVDLKEPVDEAIHTKNMLSDKIKKIYLELSQSVKDLEWLEDNFQLIKQNYSNFTATDIDLSDTYVIEAINKTRSHLNNMTGKFFETNDTAVDLFQIIDETDEKYKEFNFDRSNIENIMNHFIKPNLEVIQESGKSIDQILDQITVNVEKIDRSIKGVNDTIHITNKQLFEDRQKKLLADMVFPDLETNTFIANKSISATIDNIYKQTEKLQDVMDIYNDLTERLEKFPSVNISLQNEGIQLIQFNKTLQNASDRMIDFIKELKHINNTLWLNEGERYLQNETIDDMKKRYKLAEDKLNQLFEDIGNLDLVLEQAENGTARINNEMRSLNDSLNLLEETNAFLDKLSNDVSRVDADLNYTMDIVENNDKNLDKVVHKVRDIKQEFSGINRTLFDQHVDPIDDRIQKQETVIRFLKGNISEVVAELIGAKENIKSVLNNNKANTNSRSDLDSVINENKKILNNVDNALKEVKFVLEDIRRDANDVDDTIDVLEEDVGNMEDVFTRQQKIEYFTKNFPMNKYKKMNKTLTDVKSIETNIKSQLKTTFENFNEMNSSLTNMDNLTFNVSHLLEAIFDSNATIDNTTTTLQQLTNKYIELETLLHADDGLLVSDNETLDEMKTRYQKMYTEMQTIQSILDDVMQTFKNHNISLYNNNEDIATVDSLIDDYGDVIKDVNNIENQMNEWNRTSSHFDKIVTSFVNQLKDGNVTFESLKSEFNGVRNISNINLTDVVAESIGNLSTLIETLKLENASLKDLFTEAETTITKYAGVVKSEHNDINKLRDILDQYPFINESVSSNIVAMKSVNNSATKNEDFINGNIQQMNEDLEKLKRMFELEEKLEFIQKHKPILKHKLQKARRQVKDAFTDIRALNSSLGRVSEVLQIVNDSINEEPSLIVSIVPITDRVRDWNDEIENFRSHTAGLENTLYDTNFDSFLNGTNVANVSIEYLQNAFKTFNKTLNDVLANTSEIQRAGNDLQENVTNTEHWLKGVSMDFGQLATLRKDVDKVLHLTNDTAILINETDEKMDVTKQQLSKLKEDLKKISVEFTSVKSDTLNQKWQMLDDALTDLFNKFTSLHEIHNNTKKNFEEGEDDIEKLNDVISNVLYDLDYVKHKVKQGQDLNEKINETMTNIQQTSLNIQNDTKSGFDLEEMGNEIAALKKLYLERQKLDYIKEYAPVLKAKMNNTIEGIKNSIKYINTTNSSNEALKKVYEIVQTLVSADDTIDIPLSLTDDAINIISDNITSLGSFAEELLDIFASIDPAVLSENGSFFSENQTLIDVHDAFETLNNTLNELYENVRFIQKSLDNTNKNIDNESNFLNTLKSEARKLEDIKKQTVIVKDDISGIDRQLNEVSNALLEQDQSIMSMGKTLGELVNDLTALKNASAIEDIAREIQMDITLLHNQYTNSSKLLNVTEDDFFFIRTDSKALDKVMNNVSKTLKDLHNRTGEAISLHQHIAKELKIVNNSLEDIKRNKDMDSELQVVKQKIKTLRHKIKEQEKLEYIKEHAPKLKQLIDESTKKIKQAEAGIDDVQFYTGDIDKLLAQVKNRTQKASVNIPVTPFAETIEGIKQTLPRMDDVSNLTHSSILNINDNILSEDGSYFDKNDSLRDIVKAYEEVYSILAEVDKNVSSIETFSSEANDKLNSTRTSIENMIEKVDIFLTLKSQMNKTNNKLRQLDDMRNKVMLASENKLEQILNLNSTLNNVTNMYMDVKDEALERDASLLLKQINDLHGHYLNDIQAPLKESDRSLFTSNDTFKEMMDLIDSDIITVNDLTNKTNTARNATQLISEKANILESSFQTINNTIFDGLLNITELEKNVNDLRERFKKQQIYNYIKEHFPTVLEKMNNVNKSLTVLDENIPQVNSTINQLGDNVSLLSEKLAAIKHVNIPLDNMLIDLDTHKDAFVDAIDEKNKLENEFSTLHDVISSNIDSNETLEDIKTRFEGYESKLHVMDELLRGIKGDLNNTHSDALNISMKVDLYHNNIDRFSTTDARANGMNNRWWNEKLNIKNVSDKIGHLEDDLGVQTTIFNEIINRFSLVNSSELHKERLAVEQNIANGNDTLEHLIDNFNRKEIIFKELGEVYKNATDILQQNITTFEELKNVSKQVDDILNTISPQQRDIEDTLSANTTKTVEEIGTTLLNITAQTENLRLKFLEKEKLDYVQKQIKNITKRDNELRKDMEDVEKHIVGKMKDINELNETRSYVQEKLNTRDNFLFTTEDLKNQITSMIESIVNEGNKLSANGISLDQLNTSQFSDIDWLNMTMEEIKSAFIDLNNDLTEINSSIVAIKNVTDNLGVKVDKEFKDLNDTNSILNTYFSLENKSLLNEKELKLLSYALNTTNASLENTSNMFDHNRKKLVNLSTQYPGVTNDNIEESLTLLNGIHENVSLRIPLTKRNFRGILMENYNEISKQFDGIVDILNKNFTDKDRLRNVLEDATDSLMNVTSERENMNDIHDNYREYSTNLLSLVSNSTLELDKLEAHLNKQVKYDLLNANLPELKTQWKMLNDTTKSIKANIDELSNKQNVLKMAVANISSRMETIPTVNISTDNESNQLQHMHNVTENLNNEMESLNGTLQDILVFDIDVNSLAKNSSVSILDVQSQIQNLRNRFKTLDNNYETLGESIVSLNKSVVESKENTSSLNDTLNRFIEVENKLTFLNDSLNVFNDMEEEATSRLEDSDRKLNFYRESLADLKSQYEKYKYDSSDVEILLNLTGDKIAAINDNLLNTKHDLNLAKDEYKSMNERLYTMEDERQILNKTLMNISLDYPSTENKLIAVNKSLEEILGKIPDVFVQLKDIEEQILTMNSSLKADDLKSGFVDKVLPVLQDKYEQTNKTFFLTNRTLDKMANDIVELAKFVEALKERMNDFSTINISMTDMDNNITYLENRLLIMQDHYKNVKEIVSGLHDDLETNNIFGRNITLVDVKYQYTNFNGTLDRINEILASINDDAIEAEEHFDTLNMTAKNIDKALDIFEQKSLDVKELNNDIAVVGDKLEKSNSDVKTMDIAIKNLSTLFDDMKSQYSDVLDFTAENNSVVSKMIQSANTSIIDLKNLLHRLGDGFNSTADNFIDLNGTLFENVDTYDALNNTLGNVKDKYLDLSKTLSKLQYSISKATEATDGTNSSLSQISTMLQSLNDTLFREQEKFDFLKNNLGALKEKIQNLKSPLDTAGETLVNVSDKVNQTHNFVDIISSKLKKFKNIHIDLNGDVVQLQNMNKKIADSKALLKNFSNSIDELEKKVKSLDDRSRNITDIVTDYGQIDSSLDDLHNNLTSMFSAIDEMNFNTDIISNKTSKLDASLNELSVLDKSSSDVGGSLDSIAQNITESDSTIKDMKTNADGLFDAIEQMKNMYGNIDNEALKNNMTELLAKLNATNIAILDIDNKQSEIMRSHSMVYDNLKNIKDNIHGEIRNQTALDAVTEQSRDGLGTIANDTEILTQSQNQVNSNALTLMKEVEELTQELYKLNETMAEEKRKQEFMAENFPHIKTRHNALNTAIGAMNESLDDTNRNVGAVAKKLTDVKKQLNMIKEIAIPLNAEEDEIALIQQQVNDIIEEYENVSNTYDQLKLSELQDKSKSFNQITSTYNDFNTTLGDLEKRLEQMTTQIKDLNVSAGVIDESMNDISVTADEYIATGEKISGVIASGETLTNTLKATNESVAEKFSKLQNLNESLETLLKNFSHIDDPEIKQAKELLKTLFLASEEKINGLQDGIGKLHDAKKDSNKMISNLNDTHKTSKTALDQLKQHIQQINQTAQSVESKMENIDSKRSDIGNNTEKLNPELDKLMDKINELASTFMTEQEKIDVIAANLPTLKKRLKNLTEPLAATNGHISLTEVKLADLKYEIKTTGTRLDKFRTINITTNKEMKDWTTMNSTVMNLSKNFSELSNKYQSLQNAMKTLNDRSITKAEINKKIRSMNMTLSAIEKGMSNINEKLNNVEGQIINTENVLQGMLKSMDNFKKLQTETVKTETAGKSTNRKVGNLQKLSNDLKHDIVTLNKKVKMMNTLYAPLNDKTWNSAKGKIQKGISTMSQNVGKVKKSIDGLDKSFNTTSTKLKDFASSVRTKQMTRDNIDTSITSLLGNITQVGRQLTNMQAPIKTQNGKLNTLKKSVDSFKSTVRRLNTTLHKELLKYNYVEENLPSLKDKHMDANQSFIANIPDIDNMKGQLSNLVSVITKIKDKMTAFGLEDTDLSLKKWDDVITKLNNTVTMIVKKNEETTSTLNNLKKQIWSKNQYTRKDTLKNVKTRFENINKTLDDIKAASHAIKVSLKDVGARASEVISQLMERDSILTTTPATTTPSGPPDWLTMDSTIEGVIGKDPGFVECAAADLIEWETMKITRINRDGEEQPIAFWKQGIGARRTVRDRRIRARKTEDSMGGNLNVTISQLQCEDEGSYYCYIDAYSMWPLETTIDVISPPEDNIKPDFPTEVFEDKITNFSCTGQPGYPSGRMTWMVKHEHEAHFRPIDFYSSKRKISDAGCVRTETNIVEYQFNMTWNNTRIRCYIENTQYFAEGKVQLLPSDICSTVRSLGTIRHPYTPHKYIFCGRELSIMQCPGGTCFDDNAETCVQCKEGVSEDPCHGKPYNTYVPHEYDCKKYYVCLGVTKSPKQCVKGYFAPNIVGNCVLSYAQSLCGQKESLG